MIEQVLSGGQSGVDQAAWRAARAAGIATGGWMPLGFATEDGPRPEFEREFDARARDSSEYAERTIANVRDADAVLVIAGDHCGAGVRLTIETCRALARPYRVVDPDELASEQSAREAATWIEHIGARRLNVAGDRASALPGIGPRAEAYLAAVFRALVPHAGTGQQQ
jgi:hypothetical protein